MVCLIIIQVNKQGAFVGSNSILHEVDVEIKVEDGFAVTGKNRFGISGSGYNIFSGVENNEIRNEVV